MSTNEGKEISLQLIYNELVSCRGEIGNTCKELHDFKERVTPMLFDYETKQKRKDKLFDFKSMTVAGVISAVIGVIAVLIK